MAAEYDTTEALDILARAAGAHSRHTAARQAAAIACLAALEKLVKEIDPSRGVLYLDRHSADVLEVGSVNDGRISFRATDGGFITTRNHGDPSFLRMSYNTSSGLLEGTEDDTFFSPGPDQPRRKRSALAVLSEEVAKAIAPVAQKDA